MIPMVDIDKAIKTCDTCQHFAVFDCDHAFCEKYSEEADFDMEACQYYNERTVTDGS